MLRIERGMRQADVAEAIGISRSTLAGIERGIDLPGRETLASIAKFFGASIDYIESGAKPPVAPGAGEFIENPDELALVAFWRSLTPDERRMVLKLMQPPARPDAES